MEPARYGEPATEITGGEKGRTMNRNDTLAFVRVLLAVMLFGSPLALASCNTAEGAGEDVQAAGRAIEDAAHDD